MASKDLMKDLSLEKIPPQNLEAEMAVLGSMLIDEDAISRVIEILDAQDFYKEANRKIFQAIIKLYDSNKVVDLVTLREELEANGLLSEVGGSTYLTSLTQTVPTSANAARYAQIVKEKAIQRNLIVAATQIVSESYEPEGDVGQLLDKAERLVFDIASKKVEGNFLSLREIIKDSIEIIDKLYQRKTTITGIATGFADFDIQTAGLQPSDLIVIAGRPSMGKSALVSCIAEYIGVVSRIPVVFFSLEMSREQLVQRMLCSHARVDAHKVRTGFLSQSDWPRLTAAAGRLSDAPIFIDDSSSLTALELRAKARRLKSQHDIRVIIVDYLQMMRGHGKIESRQQEIAEISRSLKALAKELNVPLIAVSQLSRSPEKREDRRPQLADLRESGAIEQDADVVTLLFREEFYNPTEENRGITELNIAKQRNGPVGTIRLAFIKEYTRFENLSKRQTP